MAFIDSTCDSYNGSSCILIPIWCTKPCKCRHHITSIRIFHLTSHIFRIDERSKSAAEKIQRRHHSKIFSGNVCGGNCKKADDTGEYSDNQIFQNQIGYEGITKIKSDDKIYSLNDCGAAGLTGKYVDENTFAGSQYFDLSGKEFPDQFQLEIYIYNITLIAENVKNQNISIWGQWKFSIPIQVNKEDVTMYEVNEWNEGYSIDEVIVTPIITTIKTTHPDIYRDNFNYDVLVYGDENGTEELTMQGFYDETKGVFKVSTKDITTDLYIYVIDESRMSKKKTDTDFREELEQRAIVRKVIHLQ